MKDPKVNLYVRGTNSRLDELLDPLETVWIVNWTHGRCPVAAETEEEAIGKYLRRHKVD